jgi:hypothetical protein
VGDLHCDIASPLWYVWLSFPGLRFASQLVLIRPRLLGYAGAPIILFTPCFILSIVTAVRILRMHARIRELRAEGGDRRQSTCVVSNGSRMITSGPSAATPVSGLSAKLPSSTLDVQIGVTVDVQLHGSLTRYSSRVSATGILESNSSFPHIPIELPSLSPMTFPFSYLPQPSPSSTKNLGLPDVDRGRTPSPIVFARAPVPSSQHHSRLDAAGEPCDSGCASSGCDPETVLPPHVTVSEEPPASPVSPSRIPISLEFGERMPRFHLPTRSPPNGLRPSLELSPEYARARFEADRATLTRCLENLPSSPCSSHRQLLSSFASAQSPDIIGSFHLEGLPEVDGTDKGSIAQSECDFVDERKVVCPGSPEPAPLKPVRQYYREQLLTPPSRVTD